ncbi:MAG: LuxR C-terminal-related transcriptional regulator, partial [Muribaculaceae bacterium]|nr:LuxR C-terminal-related transcriptional regulator [Muribaculaceae bacterium]
LAAVENVIVVVSDLVKNRSHIIEGGFASALGLNHYHHENSIWEKRILSMMSEDEQEAMFVSELRFFHFIRHLPVTRRRDYYMLSKLRFDLSDEKSIDVLHKMFYLYHGDAVRFAICTYGPLYCEFPGKSCIVNSITGITEELTSLNNDSILTRREQQVLNLIDRGFKSKEISESLNISIHTVSRHRQEILSKLQVKNSFEACRTARSLGII